MNNLYRELAPVSAAAWAGIEEEAKRTFARHAAARKAVDVTGPDGLALAGLGTGHVTAVEPPADGVTAVLRDWRPVVELRVPFTLSRAEIDSVERGALDPDWQPVKDAAKKIAFAEDRAVFDGYAAAQITGVRQASSNPAVALPGEVRDYPDVVSKAVSQLRLAGVAGPYSLLLSADAWTAVSETSDHGYPIREHLARVLDGDIIWAPAIDGALLLTGRGGDFELRLGQTCRSATCPTTRTRCSCTSPSRSPSPFTRPRRASRSRLRRVMTTLDGRPNTALLVIDVPERRTGRRGRQGRRNREHRRPWSPPPAPLVCPSSGSSTSDDGLPFGSEGWQLVPQLRRHDGEPLVYKVYGDSFEATDLEEILAGREIGR